MIDMEKDLLRRFEQLEEIVVKTKALPFPPSDISPVRALWSQYTKIYEEVVELLERESEALTQSHNRDRFKQLYDDFCVLVEKHEIAIARENKAKKPSKKTSLIAPYTENWNKGECDWSFVKDPRVAIENWEKQENISLPPDYRNFLLKFNGGRVYPRLFTHTIGALQAGPYVDSSSVTYVGIIYSWATVESHWRRETYGDGVPPNYLIFADTPGGIELLMSMNRDDYGKIYTWPHCSDIWGTDRNTKIYYQANNFTQLLKSLFDDDEQSDYEGWHRPIYDKLAKELVI